MQNLFLPRAPHPPPSSALFISHVYITFHSVPVFTQMRILLMLLLLLAIFHKVSVVIFSIMCIMLFSLLGFDGGPKTRMRNLTDKSVDVQIRVGSLLQKGYRLGPGGSKTLKRNDIYKRYAPRGKSTLYCEGSCEPYVWIHSSSASWATARQQYVSLEDLQACREMKICKDSKKGGGFSVLKVSRAKSS